MTTEESATLEPYSLSSVLFSYLWVYRILFPSASTLHHHLPPPHLVTPPPCPGPFLFDLTLSDLPCRVPSYFVSSNWRGMMSVKCSCTEFETQMLIWFSYVLAAPITRCIRAVSSDSFPNRLMKMSSAMWTDAPLLGQRSTLIQSLANCVINDIIYIVGESVSSHV